MGSEKVFIIGEAGVNHNGKLSLALKLVDVAVEAGVDAVKFQTFKADNLVTADADVADYARSNLGYKQTQLELLRTLELDAEAHRQLKKHCETKAIEFLSTPFDLDSIRFLNALGVRRLKVPSGEITNLPYLRAIARAGKPVILSTGMADLSEVKDAVRILMGGGIAAEELTILHCTTQYPTPPRDVNLRVLETLREAFPGVKIGYSDHTEGITIPVAAAARGAEVIEKHFTLDRRMEGPDHAASLEPAELCEMVAAIRTTELALGSRCKEPSASELPNRAVARKSIVAGKRISAGDAFTEENLTTKRPGSGLSPMCWDEVVGQIARRDFDLDEMIEI